MEEIVTLPSLPSPYAQAPPPPEAALVQAVPFEVRTLPEVLGAIAVAAEEPLPTTTPVRPDRIKLEVGERVRLPVGEREVMSEFEPEAAAPRAPLAAAVSAALAPVPPFAKGNGELSTAILPKPSAVLAPLAVEAPVPPWMRGNTPAGLAVGGAAVGPVKAETATASARPPIKRIFTYKNFLLNLLSILQIIT